MPLKFLTSIFGSRNDRLLKLYRKTVVQINALEAGLESLSDEELRAMSDQERLDLFVAPPALCTDNAAMIAACAYYRPWQAGLDVAVDPNLAFV